MAYFDNAATTYPKPECVYSFMDEFYRQSGGSAGRGQYKLAQSAREIIEDTRTRIKNLLHCPAKQVVFEPTATISLNIIIQGMVAKGVRNIYISPFEHNAVTRTLHHFEATDLIRIIELSVTSNLQYDLERIRYQFDEVSPNMVIVSHASNVIGLVAPVEEIFTLAKQYEAVTLVDMAQTAGLIDCNIGMDIFDFAVFAGHKTLLGPTGVSGFVMKPEIDLPPILFGGTGYDSANPNMPFSLPERYEMGTLNISGVAGLNASLKWIEERTVNYLREKEVSNRVRLISLIEKFDFISVIGNEPNAEYIGIVSCLLDGISSDDAAKVFSSLGISVRTGLQCAPRAHKFLDTFPAGTIRLSVNALTTDDDFEQLENALLSIEEEL